MALSKILRQSPSCVEPNKISVVEKYVTEVDPLPDRFLEVEILFLSHNSISTLAGFKQVRQLLFSHASDAGGALLFGIFAAFLRIS